MDNRYSRRNILKLGGTALATGIAGCTGESSENDYAGLKSLGVDTEEGLDAWVDRIDYDGEAYTFYGGIENELDEKIDTEVRPRLLYELPGKQGEYEPLSKPVRNSYLYPHEEESFENYMGTYDKEPTHWRLEASYHLVNQ